MQLLKVSSQCSILNSSMVHVLLYSLLNKSFKQFIEQARNEFLFFFYIRIFKVNLLNFRSLRIGCNVAYMMLTKKMFVRYASFQWKVTYTD